ncbi:MAG: PKD domain-containing protein [Actinomycetia bacterium]|nr:PKD domain-containing protein [Actinomycetes bacterium]
MAPSTHTSVRTPLRFSLVAILVALATMATTLAVVARPATAAGGQVTATATFPASGTTVADEFVVTRVESIAVVAGEAVDLSIGAAPVGATATWDLGDGNTVNGADITHIYQRPGRYTAHVTLYNTNLSLIGSSSIEVLASPFWADFGPDVEDTSAQAVWAASALNLFEPCGVQDTGPHAGAALFCPTASPDPVADGTPVGSAVNGTTGATCTDSPTACGLLATAFNAADPVAALATVGQTDAAGNLLYDATVCTDNWAVQPDGTFAAGVEQGCVSRGAYLAALLASTDRSRTGDVCQRAVDIGVITELSDCNATSATSKQFAYGALAVASGFEASTDAVFADLSPADPAHQVVAGTIVAGAPLVGNLACPTGIGICFNGHDGITRMDLAVLLTDMLPSEGFDFGAAGFVNVWVDQPQVAAGEPVHVRADVFATSDPVEVTWATTTLAGTPVSAAWNCNGATNGASNVRTLSADSQDDDGRLQFDCNITGLPEGDFNVHATVAGSGGITGNLTGVDYFVVGNTAPIGSTVDLTSQTFDEDGSHTYTLSQFGVDPDGHAPDDACLSVTVASPASGINTAASQTGNGLGVWDLTLTVTSTDDTNGNWQAIVRVCDEHGALSAPTTIDGYVVPVNDAPRPATSPIDVGNIAVEDSVTTATVTGAFVEVDGDGIGTGCHSFSNVVMPTGMVVAGTPVASATPGVWDLDLTITSTFDSNGAWQGDMVACDDTGLTSAPLRIAGFTTPTNDVPTLDGLAASYVFTGGSMVVNETADLADARDTAFVDVDGSPCAPTLVLSQETSIFEFALAFAGTGSGNEANPDGTLPFTLTADAPAGRWDFSQTLTLGVSDNGCPDDTAMTTASTTLTLARPGATNNALGAFDGATLDVSWGVHSDTRVDGYAVWRYPAGGSIASGVLHCTSPDRLTTSCSAPMARPTGADETWTVEVRGVADGSTQAQWEGVDSNEFTTPFAATATDDVLLPGPAAPERTAAAFSAAHTVEDTSGTVTVTGVFTDHTWNTPSDACDVVSSVVAPAGVAIDPVAVLSATPGLWDVDVTVTSTGNANGPWSIAYAACDDEGLVAAPPATIIGYVDPVNDLPSIAGLASSYTTNAWNDTFGDTLTITDPADTPYYDAVGSPCSPAFTISQETSISELNLAFNGTGGGTVANADGTLPFALTHAIPSMRWDFTQSLTLGAADDGCPDDANKVTASTDIVIGRPLAPTGITAAIVGSDVQVSWDAHTDQRIDGYLVYWYPSGSSFSAGTLLCSVPGRMATTCSTPLANVTDATPTIEVRGGARGTWSLHWEGAQGNEYTTLGATTPLSVIPAPSAAPTVGPCDTTLGTITIGCVEVDFENHASYDEQIQRAVATGTCVGATGWVDVTIVQGTTKRSDFGVFDHGDGRGFCYRLRFSNGAASGAWSTSTAPFNYGEAPAQTRAPCEAGSLLSAWYANTNSGSPSNPTTAATGNLKADGLDAAAGCEFNGGEGQRARSHIVPGGWDGDEADAPDNPFSGIWDNTSDDPTWCGSMSLYCGTAGIGATVSYTGTPAAQCTSSTGTAPNTSRTLNAHGVVPWGDPSNPYGDAAMIAGTWDESGENGIWVGVQEIFGACFVFGMSAVSDLADNRSIYPRGVVSGTALAPGSTYRIAFENSMDYDKLVINVADVATGDLWVDERDCGSHSTVSASGNASGSFNTGAEHCQAILVDSDQTDQWGAGFTTTAGGGGGSKGVIGVHPDVPFGTTPCIVIPLPNGNIVAYTVDMLEFHQGRWYVSKCGDATPDTSSATGLPDPHQRFTVGSSWNSSNGFRALADGWTVQDVEAWDDIRAVFPSGPPAQVQPLSFTNGDTYGDLVAAFSIPDSNGTPITHYTVTLYNQATHLWWQTQTVSPSNDPACNAFGINCVTFTGLTPVASGAYQFYAYAHNSQGQSPAPVISPSAGIASTIPDAPQWVSAVAGVGDGTNHLDWTEPSMNGLPLQYYGLVRYACDYTWNYHHDLTPSSFGWAGNTAGAQWRYQVFARNAHGWSAGSGFTDCLTTTS